MGGSKPFPEEATQARGDLIAMDTTALEGRGGLLYLTPATEEMRKWAEREGQGLGRGQRERNKPGTIPSKGDRAG